MALLLQSRAMRAYWLFSWTFRLLATVIASEKGIRRYDSEIILTDRARTPDERVWRDDPRTLGFLNHPTLSQYLSTAIRE